MIEKKMKIQIGRNVIWLDKDNNQNNDTNDDNNKDKENNI
jgi:hypothetical protein